MVQDNVHKAVTNIRQAPVAGEHVEIQPPRKRRKSKAQRQAAARAAPPSSVADSSSGAKGGGKKGSGKGQPRVLNRTPDGRMICFKHNFDNDSCDGSCGMCHLCCWSTCLKQDCKAKTCPKAKAEGFVLRPRRA